LGDWSKFVSTGAVNTGRLLSFYEEEKRRARERLAAPPSGQATETQATPHDLLEFLKDHCEPYLSRGYKGSVWLKVPVSANTRRWVRLESEDAAEYLAQAYARVCGEFLAPVRERQLFRILRGLARTLPVKRPLDYSPAARARMAARSTHSDRRRTTARSPRTASSG
jgi:hypothetical protein